MRADLPTHVLEFLRAPNHAVVGWIGDDGRPRTVATWYDVDDDAILLNLAASRRRLHAFAIGSSVALTALDHGNWYRHISLDGEITEVWDDSDLRDIDRLSIRYTGSPYRDRVDARVSVRMDVRGWNGWDSGSRWPGSSTAKR